MRWLKAIVHDDTCTQCNCPVLANRLEHQESGPVKVWESELPESCFRCHAILKWERHETVDWRDDIELVECVKNGVSSWHTDVKTAKDKSSYSRYGGHEYDFEP